MTIEGESAAKSFGRRLQEQRELRQVALEDISKITKISIHMLQAMERDEWDKLPGGIFTRNFIRLYANHLGLEAEKWVDQFRLYMREKEGGEEENEGQQESEDRRRDSAPVWPYVLLVAVMVLLIGGYLAISMLYSGGESIEPAKTSNPIRASLPGDRPSTAAAEAPAAERMPIEVVLERSGDRYPPEKYWFRSWVDDAEPGGPATRSGVLENGERVTLKADKRLIIDLHHISDIRIFLNGREVDWRDDLHVETIGPEGAMYQRVIVLSGNAGER